MSSTKIVGIFLLILGVTILTLSLLYINSIEHINFYEIVKEAYWHVSAALLSIALTILVIDHLNEKRKINQEKRLLIQGLRSPVRNKVEESLESLRTENWIEDSTLSKINLIGLNFEKLDFKFVNFEGTCLKRTILNETIMESGNLKNVDMTWCVSKRGNFEGAILIGAKLNDGNYLYCSFKETKLSDLTISDTSFTNSDFSGADLCNLIAKKILFSDCILDTSNLMFMECDECDFQRANLSNSNITSSNISKSNFQEAVLCNLFANQVSIKDSDFSFSEIENSEFKDSHVINSNFTKSSLRDTIMTNSNFKNSNFTDADLTKCDFSNSDLSNCSFKNANLSFANLSNCDLTNSILDGANLKGAILKGAKFNDSQLLYTRS